MKTKLISILLTLSICISMFAGCSAELKTSGYSDVLKAAFYNCFSEDSEVGLILRFSSSPASNPQLVILDVSSFNEENISGFIEYATEQFNKYNEQLSKYSEKYILITKSNKEDFEKETHRNVELTNISFSFDNSYNKPNKEDFASVAVNIHYRMGGYGFVLELEKIDDVWKIEDYVPAWNS